MLTCGGAGSPPQILSLLARGALSARRAARPGPAGCYPERQRQGESRDLVQSQDQV